MVSLNAKNPLKLTISPSVWGAQHPNAGQNIQQGLLMALNRRLFPIRRLKNHLDATSITKMVDGSGSGIAEAHGCKGKKEVSDKVVEARNKTIGCWNWLRNGEWL